MNNLEPEKNSELKDENLLEEKNQQNNKKNENSDKGEDKLPCEVVEDLLPLYEEKLVGETTAKLIENHAQSCPSCRERIFALKAQEELPCETIGDLLPLYSEGLTGEVTTKLIEKHLKTCSKCAEKLSSLQSKQNEDKEKALETYIGENPIAMEELTAKKRLLGKLKPNNNAKPSTLSQAAPLKKMKKELSRRRRNAVFLAMSLLLLVVAVLLPLFIAEGYYIPYKEGLVKVSKDEEGSLVAEFDSEIPIRGLSGWGHITDEDKLVYYFTVTTWKSSAGEGRTKQVLASNSFTEEMLFSNEDDKGKNKRPLGKETREEDGYNDEMMTDEGNNRIPDSVIYLDFTTKETFLLYGKEYDDFDEITPMLSWLDPIEEVWKAKLAASIAMITGLIWLILAGFAKNAIGEIAKYLCLAATSVFLAIIISSGIKTIFHISGMMGATILSMILPIFGVLVFGLALLKQYQEDQKA